MLIDTSFDFRTDTPVGQDPDAYSPTLRQYHKLLWSKALPSGAEDEAFRTIGYTIGAMMVYPARQIEGKSTINQARRLDGVTAGNG